MLNMLPNKHATDEKCSLAGLRSDLDANLSLKAGSHSFQKHVIKNAKAASHRTSASGQPNAIKLSTTQKVNVTPERERTPALAD